MPHALHPHKLQSLEVLCMLQVHHHKAHTKTQAHLAITEAHKKHRHPYLLAIIEIHKKITSTPKF